MLPRLRARTSKQHHCFKSYSNFTEELNFSFCCTCIGKGVPVAYKAGLFSESSQQIIRSQSIFSIQNNSPRFFSPFDEMGKKKLIIFHHTPTTLTHPGQNPRKLACQPYKELLLLLENTFIVAISTEIYFELPERQHSGQSVWIGYKAQ